MKAQDHEGKTRKDLLQDWQQECLRQVLTGGDDLVLGDAVHGVDVIEPLRAVLIALMHAVDADEAGAAVGGGRAALPDGDGIAAGLGPVGSGPLVAGVDKELVAGPEGGFSKVSARGGAFRRGAVGFGAKTPPRGRDSARRAAP